MIDRRTVDILLTVEQQEILLTEEQEDILLIVGQLNKRIYCSTVYKNILLGFDSFDKMLKYRGEEDVEIVAIPIVRDRLENGILKVGTIDGIPTIQLPHPSRGWKFHNFFVPLFVKMWKQIVNEKRPFTETAEKINNNLTRLVAIDD